MQVKLWGVRGSLPSPHTPQAMEERVRSTLKLFESFRAEKKSDDIEEFIAQLESKDLGGFGGNTACIEVSTPQQSIIIDGGSGIRGLGERLMAGPCGKGQGEVHILFTHFHWDHLIGVPFFIPFFIPGNKIHCYAVSEGIEENIRRMFTKPNFPVPFERLGAEVHFHQLEPRKPREFGDTIVTPYQLDHPDPCWGYRIENEGKVFSYCVDTEGVRVSPEDLGKDLPLYQGVDLMVYDAQYTFMEATEKIDWGHASAPIGLDIAMREGIKRVYFVHHDPAASDEKIAWAEKQTRDYYAHRLQMAQQLQKELHEVEWHFASEGTVLEV